MSESRLSPLNDMFLELDEDTTNVESKSDSQLTETDNEQDKIASEDTADQLWSEYNRALNLYSDKKFTKNARRVMLDPDIAETLRIMEKTDTFRTANAILRAFILTYRDRLKKQSSPKPKILL